MSRFDERCVGLCLARNSHLKQLSDSLIKSDMNERMLLNTISFTYIFLVGFVINEDMWSSSLVNLTAARAMVSLRSTCFGCIRIEHLLSSGIKDERQNDR